MVQFAFITCVIILATMVLTQELFNNDQSELRTTSNITRTILNVMDERGIEKTLTNVAVDVFRLQNENNSNPSPVFTSFVVAIIFDNIAWRSALLFTETITKLHQGTQCLHYHLDGDKFNLKNLTEIFDSMMHMNMSVNTVAIFLEDRNQVLDIFKTTSSFINLRWTSIIHITEWIIVSSSSGLLENIKKMKLSIDFITLIYQSETDIFSIAQKSRSGYFHQILTEKISTLYEGKYNEVSNNDFIEYLDKSVLIRPHPLVFLKSKKSIMADLHIPAAISVKNYKRISYKETVGNVTIYGGFTIELLRIMAAVLGFTCNFVTVYDGGGYGEALSNGTVTGMTGLLARRETGVAALVSRLQNRARVIEFLPTILMEETANIVYRLPKAGESLDLTYIKIIQPQFLLSLVGPVIMIAIVGALVHVATKECSSHKPRKFSIKDLRRLRSFLPHIFFLSDSYPGQTGRILIGTWGTFCLILWSAYSAYLVTTFATKPNELTIKTFQQLVEHSEFRIGMLGSGNALAIILKTSNDKVLQKIWNRVLECNKTDPLSFSSDLLDHVKRIVAGRYAFIDNFSIASGLFYDFLPPNYTDVVRAYPQTSLQETSASYVAIPQRVFYKDTLYNLHLDLEMAGIIYNLQKMYFSTTLQDSSRAQHEGNVVDFARIEFLVYIVVAGVVIALVCLVVELLVARLNESEKGNK